MTEVYVSMSLDLLHHGHINIIEHARKYGEITIGLLTDEAILEYKRAPYMTYSERERVAKNFQGVVRVVPQNEWDYCHNIRKYSPKFFVHGDNWNTGFQKKYKDNALLALNEVGCELIEIAYTHGIDEYALSNEVHSIVSSADRRRSSLKRMLESNKLVRILEVHSPLSGLVAEHTYVEVDGARVEFDGFWSSSLTDSTLMGRPDTESLDIAKRLDGVNNIFDVTTKPLVFDADTGKIPEHFALNVKSMERLGISAVIIEDKTGLKKNSLFGNSVSQSQASIEDFSHKISLGKTAQLSGDFMIIARIESLILDQPVDDAITRAHSYVKAGADGIMIHSRMKDPSEILNFAKIFRSQDIHTPLVCVPTSYNSIFECELKKAGFNMVIYANHMLRASYPAMKLIAESILSNGRSLEADSDLMSIKSILDLIPGTR